MDPRNKRRKAGYLFRPIVATARAAPSFQRRAPPSRLDDALVALHAVNTKHCNKRTARRQHRYICVINVLSSRARIRHRDRLSALTCSRGSFFFVLALMKISTFSAGKKIRILILCKWPPARRAVSWKRVMKGEKRERATVGEGERLRKFRQGSRRGGGADRARN